MSCRRSNGYAIADPIGPTAGVSTQIHAPFTRTRHALHVHHKSAAANLVRLACYTAPPRPDRPLPRFRVDARCEYKARRVVALLRIIHVPQEHSTRVRHSGALPDARWFLKIPRVDAASDLNYSIPIPIERERVNSRPLHSPLSTPALFIPGPPKHLRALRSTSRACLGLSPSLSIPESALLWTSTLPACSVSISILRCSRSGDGGREPRRALAILTGSPFLARGWWASLGTPGEPMEPRLQPARIVLDRASVYFSPPVSVSVSIAH
ncbi:hypothetical protein C8R44DRAFT_981907 [Mycena epipterygia]|nr:hypothetical protein C8R44DRAFT_981907 [Mycena epipterygia]